jgi:hypothetical protein
MWLQKSIISAKGILDSTSKAKALATSFNNLAGTYNKLQRFEEAEELAKLAMARWGEYENRTDQSGNRVIWAHYTLGEVYQSWAQSLKDKGENFTEIKGKAYLAFQNGKKQAEAASMSTEDVKFFAERMEQLEKLTPRE